MCLTHLQILWAQLWTYCQCLATTNPYMSPDRLVIILVTYTQHCSDELLFIFLRGLQKIGFNPNGVHMGATDAKLPAFCTEFRRLSNGTSPGVKNPIIRQQKRSNFIWGFWAMVGIESRSLNPVRYGFCSGHYRCFRIGQPRRTFQMRWNSET